MKKGPFTARSGVGEPTRAQDSYVPAQPEAGAVSYWRLRL